MASNDAILKFPSFLRFGTPKRLVIGVLRFHIIFNSSDVVRMSLSFWKTPVSAEICQFLVFFVIFQDFGITSNPQFDAKLAPNDSQMHLKSCKTVRIVSWGLFRTLKNSKMAQIAKLLRWHQMMPFCRERTENGKGLIEHTVWSFNEILDFIL